LKFDALIRDQKKILVIIKKQFVLKKHRLSIMSILALFANGEANKAKGYLLGVVGASRMRFKANFF